MRKHSVAIRIVGFVSTARGFSFSVTEGPERLIDWGHSYTASALQLIAALNLVIKRSRPLFVAAEMTRLVESRRSRLFCRILKTVCREHGIMILSVVRRCVDAEGRRVTVTNYDLAKAVAERFDIIAGNLPKRRRPWEGPNDRMGVFLATAAAATAWSHFQSSSPLRPPRKKGSRRTE